MQIYRGNKKQNLIRSKQWKRRPAGNGKIPRRTLFFCRNEYNTVFINLTFECYRCKTDVKMKIRRRYQCTPEQKRRVVCDSLYLWSNMWSKIFGDFVSGGCGGSKPLLGRKIEKIRENRTIFTDFWSEWHDLNVRPLPPQGSALPTAPHPDARSIKPMHYSTIVRRCQPLFLSFFAIFVCAKMAEPQREESSPWYGLMVC